MKGTDSKQGNKKREREKSPGSVRCRGENSAGRDGRAGASTRAGRTGENSPKWQFAEACGTRKSQAFQEAAFELEGKKVQMPQRREEFDTFTDQKGSHCV